MTEDYVQSYVKPVKFVRKGPKRGYWVIAVRVLDPIRYFNYLEVAEDAIDRLGGRIVIRSGDVIVEAGAPKPRLVVVEFDSLEAAKEAVKDIAQQTAMQLYEEVADYDLAIVEGYDDFG